MFAKLALYTLAASGLALAAPAPQLQNGPYGQCNTGQIQCCQQVVPASDLNPAVLNGLLGVVIQDVNVVVGLECTSVNVIGIESGNTCTAKPVCCESAAANGLVNIGCVPVTL